MREDISVASSQYNSRGDQLHAGRVGESSRDIDHSSVEVTNEAIHDGTIPTASSDTNRLAVMIERSTQLRDCPVCNLTFGSTHMLDEHARLRHPAFRRRCDECDGHCIAIEKLIEHQRAHLAPKPRCRCPVPTCPRSSDKGFGRLSDRKRHVKEKHPEIDADSLP